MSGKGRKINPVLVILWGCFASSGIGNLQLLEANMDKLKSEKTSCRCRYFILQQGFYSHLTSTPLKISGGIPTILVNGETLAIMNEPKTQPEAAVCASCSQQVITTKDALISTKDASHEAGRLEAAVVIKCGIVRLIWRKH